MKLLYIQGGSRWKFDNEGNVYTDANYNEKIWKRYTTLCDDFTVILRREEKIYSKKEAETKFNKFDSKKMKYVSVVDLYKPSKNYFSISKRNEIKRTLEEEIRKSDKIIIRSLGNFYTKTALRIALKLKKDVLVEVTGFIFESLWYHGTKGKLMALFNDLEYKRLMKNVDYACYVTNEALQKRYPARGKMLGCSDVELEALDSSVLDARLQRIAKSKDKLIIGTAAFLDVNWKGQKIVVKALSILKKMGITNIEYQLIGGGTGQGIMNLAKELDVADQINIIGTLPHEQVFSWFDSIDVYVQPSFQEGLCRSIVEAMSRGCPVIASNVGGNYELVSENNLYNKHDVKALSNILKKFCDEVDLSKEAKTSFNIAKDYESNTLNTKRKRFYTEFIKK